jgi:hypothetical protein
MIEQIIVISLFCVGLYILTHDFFTFLKLHEFEYKLIKDYPELWFVFKPILGCATCMASVWSFVFIERLSIELVIIAFSVAYVNTILYRLYQYFK